MARPLVLDTSALMAGRPLGPGEDTLVPAAVLAELRPGGRDRRHLDMLLAAGARVVEADPALRARVRAEARVGGEDGRLSGADVDVLAVALGLGAEVASDDYTVQNLARRLGVPVRAVAQAGIREAYRFVPRCTGCRRILDAPAEECPVCGSPVRMVKDRAFRPPG
jgi:endoribonuclease Nob1